MNASTRLFSLSDWLASIQLTGPDAVDFLQGQVTADVRKLSPTGWRYSAYNSPKGRMLAFGSLRQHEDRLQFDVEREIAPAVAKRLSMFVLRSKVRVSISDEFAFGLIGNEAPTLLAEVGLAVPEGPQGLAVSGDITILKRGFDAGYSLHGPTASIETIRTRLADRCSNGDEAGWRAAEILAGIPSVRAATQDHFVPQMANADLLGGIAFDKGCYTGQEIVARLHYLGQLKRRLYLCSGTGTAPAPGETVRGADGASVGEVCDAAALPDGRFVASAVLQVAQADTRPALLAGDVPMQIDSGFHSTPTTV